MKIEKVKKYFYKRRNAYMASFLALLAGSIILCVTGRFFDGKNHFLLSDLVAQHIPAIYSFYNALFGEESLFYSFSMGLGMPTAPTFAFEVFSPFNILFYLFKNPSVAATIVYLLKIAVIAYSFLRFAEEWQKKEDKRYIVFALFYALCGYILGAYVNLRAFDALLILPYIMRGILLVCRERRAWLLTVSYAYIFIVNYYTAYMVGVFSFVLFMLLLMTMSKSENKKIFVLCYMKAVIIAVFIGAAVLLPTAQYIFSHMAEDEAEFQGIILSPLAFANKIFLGSYKNMHEEAPLLYTGLLSVLLFPAFFANQQIEKRSKIIVTGLGVFLLVCTFVPPAYLFMHCFNAPNQFPFRFSFLFSFLFCAMGIEVATKENKKINRSILITSGVLVGLCGSLAFGKKDISGIGTIGFLVNAVLILLYIGVYARKKKIYKVCLVLIAFVEVTTNGILMFRALPNQNTEAMETYDDYVAALQNVDIPDGNIYRTQLVNGYFENDAQIAGFAGDELFSSIENPHVRRFLKNMGYTTSSRYFTNLGATEVTRMLLGIRNELRMQEEDGILQIKAQKNARCLPLAFMCADDMTDFVFDSLNAFDNSNRLVSSMVGEETLIYKRYDRTMNIMPKNLQLYTVENGYLFLRDENAEIGEICFQTVEPSSDLYIYMDKIESANDPFSMRIYTDAVEKWGRFPVVGMPAIIPLQKEADGSQQISVVSFQNGYITEEVQAISFAAIDEEALQKVYEKLLAQAAENFARKGTEISFSIEATEDKNILFTSIPFESGWHIKVDGRAYETMSIADGTFLGTVLEPGHHMVKIYYRSIWDIIGMLMTIVGIVAFIIHCILERKNSEKTL